MVPVVQGLEILGRYDPCLCCLGPKGGFGGVLHVTESGFLGVSWGLPGQEFAWQPLCVFGF